MATPTVVGATALVLGVTTGTLPAPSGIADGDRIFIICYGNSAGTYTTPPGFGIAMPKQTITGGTFIVFERTANTEGSSWPVGSSSSAEYFALVLRGADTVIDSIGPTTVTTDTASVTPVAPDALLVCLFAAAISSGSRTITAPAGMTTVAQQTATTRVGALATEVLTSNAATGTRSSTGTGSATIALGTLALTFAAPAPAVRQVGDTTAAAITAGAATLAYPAGLLQDDVLELAIAESSAMTGTPPGWAAYDVASSSVLPTSSRTYLYWLRVGAVPPAGNIDLTGIAGTGWAAVSVRRGVRTTGFPNSTAVVAASSTAVNNPSTGPATLQAAADSSRVFAVWVAGKSATRTTTNQAASGVVNPVVTETTDQTGTPGLVVATIEGLTGGGNGSTVAATATATFSATTGYNSILVDYVAATAGPATQVGAAALAAPVQLQVGATANTAGAALLAAPAAMTAGTAVDAQAAAVLAAPVALTAAGSTSGPGVITGAAALALPVALSAAGARAATAAAALAAPVQLAAAGTRAVQAAAALLLPAALVSAATRIELAATQLLLPVQAAMAGVRAQAATAALQAPVQLQAAGTAAASGGAQLGAPVALAAAGATGRVAAAVLALPARLDAAASAFTPVLPRNLTVSVRLAAQGARHAASLAAQAARHTVAVAQQGTRHTAALAAQAARHTAALAVQHDRHPAHLAPQPEDEA